MLASRLTVPTPYEDERMADVMTGGQKRSFESSRDVTNTLLNVMAKRRFTGDGALAPFRSTMPDQLVRGMRVVNSGFSSTHANTDEVVTVPIFVKPFAQGWEQDYVEYTPLFSNRAEPEMQSMAMHTVASPQVLNFVLELGALTQSRQALIARSGISDNLVEMREYLDYMIPSDAAADNGDPLASVCESFAEKWNYLGPMTTFQDAGIHSSDPNVRRSQAAQRMLGWSVFNRTKSFNLFSPTISKGDHMFFVCKEVDVSHLKNFVDPRGRAVVARTTFPARALQLMGFSEHDAPFPMHSTGYDPVMGPESFNDPAAGDLDYIQRARRIVQDYRPLEINDDGVIRFITQNDDDGVSELLRQTPEIVYRAYMEGHATKVGIARAFEGRRPSHHAIQTAHRSHEAMKMLQLVEFYNV